MEQVIASGMVVLGFAMGVLMALFIVRTIAEAFSPLGREFVPIQAVLRGFKLRAFDPAFVQEQTAIQFRVLEEVEVVRSMLPKISDALGRNAALSEQDGKVFLTVKRIGGGTPKRKEQASQSAPAFQPQVTA